MFKKNGSVNMRVPNYIANDAERFKQALNIKQSTRALIAHKKIMEKMFMGDFSSNKHTQRGRNPKTIFDIKIELEG